jgi:DNA gyrase subunit B
VKDISKLRYARIVIMTDADVDGAHIRTLLLTFFYRYFQEMVDAGHLYIAQPPLFKVSLGKDSRYAFNDAEKTKILKEWGIDPKELENQEESEEENAEESADAQPQETEAKGKSKAKVAKEAPKTKRPNIQRYKGLGEMNPQQLWETTMDPSVRVMLRVTTEDAEKANAVFTTLMGNEVAPRKKFIQTHAKGVKNLDI